MGILQKIWCAFGIFCVAYGIVFIVLWGFSKP